MVLHFARTQHASCEYKFASNRSRPASEARQPRFIPANNASRNSGALTAGCQIRESGAQLHSNEQRTITEQK